MVAPFDSEDPGPMIGLAAVAALVVLALAMGGRL